MRAGARSTAAVQSARASSLICTRAGANWDVVEAVWQQAFESMLRADPATHSVLVAEPNTASADFRQHYAELMFERFHAPGLFFAKHAVLASYPLPLHCCCK